MGWHIFPRLGEIASETQTLGPNPALNPFDLKVTSNIVDWMLVMIDRGTGEKNRNREGCMNLLE